MNENEINALLAKLAVRQKGTDSMINELPISEEEKYDLRRHYYSFRQTEPTWSDDLNRESKAVWQNSAREMIGLEKDIVASLRKDGIAFTTLDELFPNENALGRLQDDALRRKLAIEAAQEKSSFEKASFTVFLHGGGGANPELFLTDPGISECLSDTVLHITGAYLGSASKFIRFSMQSTKTLPPGQARGQSQRWHRDPDDKHILKMFVYVNDVISEGTGPFEYVRGSHSGGGRSSLFPQTPPFGMYPEEGSVEDQVEQHEIATGLGKAGTVIFADTSGLHRGGYSTTCERTMFAGIFVSSASLFGKRYRLSGDIELLDLPPLLQFALS